MNLIMLKLRSIKWVAILFMVMTVQICASDLPTLELSLIEDGGEEVLVAMVEYDGLPVEGLTVLFYVPRTFGNIILGEELTYDDGTAMVAMLPNIPPNYNGDIRVAAKLLDLETSDVIKDELLLPIKMDQVKRHSGIHRRSLSSGKTPFPILIAVITFFGAIWSIFFYTFIVIFRLKR
jgi:hypothetical protein